MRALVLSGGGFFGAYQAGAWRTLEGHYDPDLVVGASAGGLNAWAIAGGVSGEDLVRLWLDPKFAQMPALQLPRSARHGFFEDAPLNRLCQEVAASFRPRRQVALTLTRMWNCKPEVVTTEAITWRHLAASCAVPGFFSQVEIDGLAYADGGLLAHLPTWAAAQLGARDGIGVDLFPVGGWPAEGLSARLLRRHSLPAGPLPGRWQVIGPSSRLGGPIAMTFWKPERIRHLIERGARDAEAVLPWLRSEFPETK